MPNECKQDGCTAPKALPKHRCAECLENLLPMVEQVKLAEARREAFIATHGEPRDRVPKSEWPEGRRWCSGCQSFRRLGLDVAASSAKCRACASASRHQRAVSRTFGLSREEYEAILEYQGGVCAICLQRPVSRRLAVDHDHQTGEVRGLLCSRCNHELLGALHDSLSMALRAVRYLGIPPAPRALGGDLGACESCTQRPATHVLVVDDPLGEKTPEPFAICQECRE